MGFTVKDLQKALEEAVPSTVTGQVPPAEMLKCLQGAAADLNKEKPPVSRSR